MSITTPLLGLLVASGARADSPGDTDRLHQWSLRAGGESGADSSRGSTASLDYSGLALDTGVSWLHSDAPDKSGGAITDGGRGYLRYGSNALKGSVAYDVTSDEDFRHSRRWTGSLDLALKGWTVQLNVAARDTLFESFATNISAIPRVGTITAAFANADCSLRDMEYGGSLGYNINRWSVYASGTWNDYDTISCEYDVSVANSLRRLTRLQFQQVAGRFLNPAAARAGGRIGQDSRLLASELSAGFAHHWERFDLAFDYTRSQDEFGGARQNGYALTGTIAFNAVFELGVTVGATYGGSTTDPTTDSLNTPYAGAYVTVSF